MAKPKGVSDHPAKTQIEELWQQGLRGKGIVAYLKEQKLPVISSTTINRYGQRYWSTVKVTIEDDNRDEWVDNLTSRIDAIRTADVGTIKKISMRESITRTGSAFYKTIEIEPPSVVSQPLVQQAPKVQVKVNAVKAKPEAKPGGWRVGVFLPDMQIGYFEHADGTTTTHDEAAIDVAHQIMSYVESKWGLDLVVNAGDNLDFPAFSSHRSAPGFGTTTQLAINRAAQEAAIQRAVAPDARIVWLCGNHDARIINYLVDKAPPLVGLCRAGENVPVVSLQNLCRFDDYGIEFIEPYPDSELWVNDHLRFEHGSVYSSTPGGTAAKQLKSGVSVGYGHIHRQELLQETRHTARGARTHFAGSPGTLSKIDGAVPSAKTGITSKGKQAVQRHENWQAGLWIFWWQPEGKQLVSIDPVSIWGGWSLWHGMEFVANVDPDGNEV